MGIIKDPLNLGAKTSTGTVPAATLIAIKTITSVGTIVTISDGAWSAIDIIVGDYIYANNEVKKVKSFRNSENNVLELESAFSVNVTTAALNIVKPLYTSVTIYNSGSAAGSIQGATYPASSTFYVKEDTGYGVGAIVYDATGTTFNIFANVEVRVGGSSGGGGAVTIADGADSSLGAKGDSVATTNTGTFSLIALIKRLLNISQQNLPFGADYLIQSNADSNGNYQTVVYKTGGSAGTTVRTLALTFDASGNVLTYTES